MLILSTPEYAALDEHERIEYDRELKAYRDRVNQDEYIAKTNFTKGREEGEMIGMEKGRKEGRKEMIILLYRRGDTIESIATLLNTTTDDVKSCLS